MPSNKSRVKYFDFAKLFAMMLVLYAHCIQHLVNNGEQTMTYITIYTFHMPLLMVISGYFFEFSRITYYTELIKKKTNSCCCLVLLGEGNFANTHYCKWL